MLVKFSFTPEGNGRLEFPLTKEGIAGAVKLLLQLMGIQWLFERIDAMVNK